MNLITRTLPFLKQGHPQTGFTLIESMISMGLLSLAALAISYQFAEQVKSKSAMDRQVQGRNALRETMTSVAAHPEQFPAADDGSGVPIVYVACFAEQIGSKSNTGNPVFTGYFPASGEVFDQPMTTTLPCTGVLGGTNVGGIEVHVTRAPGDTSAVQIASFILPNVRSGAIVRQQNSAANRFVTTLSVRADQSTAVSGSVVNQRTTGLNTTTTTTTTTWTTTALITRKACSNMVLGRKAS